MKTIYKYAIRPAGDVMRIRLPKEAQVLSCQVQGEQPQLWVLVDPHAELEDRDFRVYGTGHPIGVDVVDLEFIGTFQLSAGALVFHLFEVFE